MDWSLKFAVEGTHLMDNKEESIVAYERKSSVWGLPVPAVGA